MRLFTVLVLALLSLPLHAETLRVYGPGGPAPAMKEAAAAFARLHKIEVVVTAGPTPEWEKNARRDADVIYSGSESMMSDFTSRFEQLNKSTVRPLYLRPSAILVRPGNPKLIGGVRDLTKPGVRIMVVNGSGQSGLWEDVAGRLGSIETVRALRDNISVFADNSGKAKAEWENNKSLDVWLIWNIWQVANPKLAEIVPMEAEYRIYRDVGIALTERGLASKHGSAFAKFLESPRGAEIFSRWGWETGGGPQHEAPPVVRKRLPRSN